MMDPNYGKDDDDIFVSQFNEKGEFDGYFLKLDYQKYFKAVITKYERLRETQNPDWNYEQKYFYNHYLDTCQNYINYYILHPTETICFKFSQYESAVKAYEAQNPEGAKLIERQSKHIFIQDQTGGDYKKGKKEFQKFFGLENQNPVTQPKVRQEKQKIIVRKDDPTIVLQQLKNAQYDSQIYTNIDIFKKESANLIFIGHVDSGKSTLTGNIMKELNQVDEQQWIISKREAKQNHMETWQLAGIADVDPQERKRGKTIQCAKMLFHLQKRRFTLFDAPGHRDYVPNMMMGACQADLAVLIISAKQGEFESGFQKDGQTKQHAMLAKALGVHNLVVAVTKMGLTDWNQNRFEDIKKEVTPYLEKSCGFSKVTYIPLDSLENQNIHTPFKNEWHSGDCLLHVLENIEIPKRTPQSFLRMPVIDKFKETGKIFIYGKIESGTMIENQTVTVLPHREPIILRQFYNAKDERIPYAIAGENVKIRIKFLEEFDLTRGDIICNNLNYCQESQQFKCNLNVLDISEGKKVMAAGYECIMHMHAIAEQVEISEVTGKEDPVSKKMVKSTFLKSDERGRAVIKIANSVCMQKYEFMPGLGRFTLRDQGKTIGFGQVIGIKPSKALMAQQKQQLKNPAEKEEASQKPQNKEQ